MKELTESQKYLKSARKIAKRIGQNKGTVSVDMVTKIKPIPITLDHNILGALFREGDLFQFKGYRKSTSKLAKGRTIKYYIINNNNDET
jgi:hypothetical protein